MEGDRRSKRQRGMRVKTKGNSSESMELRVDNQEPTFPNLPQQLITFEILIRLPVRTLLQFKTVCKEWNSIISGPEFAKSHLNFSKSSTSYNLVKSLLVDSDDGTSNNGEEDGKVWDLIPFQKRMPLVGEVSVVGFCNGLVCFYVDDISNNWFCIWNPCIHEFYEVVLPKNCYDVNNAGFGYVSSADDYKIVAIGARYAPFQSCGFVYSLRANLWTEIPQLNEKFSSLCRKMNGVLVDEILYWGCKKIIIGINLEDYTFHEVSVTLWSGDDLNCWNTCVVGGSLCAWRYFGWNDDFVELWRLEKKASKRSWMQMLKLDVSSLEDDVRGFFGFTKSGKIIMQTLYGELFTVDPDGNPPNFVSSKSGSGCAIAVSFDESLVSPHHYRNGTKDTRKLYTSEDERKAKKEEDYE